MKMMSSCLALVVCIGLASAVAIDSKKPKIIQWTREIADRQKIDERAEIYPDEQILMMSTADELNKYKFHRSQSWHDYKTGALAIKFIDSVKGEKQNCFLTEVKKSYIETLKDLHERQDKTIPAVGERMFVVQSGERVEAPSSAIKEFCQDLPIYQLLESSLSEAPKEDPVPSVPMIVRTYCFYGDIDIYFPYDLLKIVLSIFPLFNIY